MNEEITNIANLMRKKIDEMAEMRQQLEERSKRKAHAISLYDNKLALIIIKLKNGEQMKLDDIPVKKPPTTITEKIAKGICWKERLEQEEAEGLYKSLISNLEAIKAELNGLQSIFRHLEDA